MWGARQAVVAPLPHTDGTRTVNAARRRDTRRRLLTPVNDRRRKAVHHHAIGDRTGEKTMSPLLMQTPVLMFVGMSLAFGAALLYTSITDAYRD
jgi:hypothetical protein